MREPTGDIQRRASRSRRLPPVPVTCCPAYAAFTGAGTHIRTPYKGKNKPAAQKAVNGAHAKPRAPGERADTQLKTWRILRKLRCCPWKTGQLAEAIRVLQVREIGG